MEESESSSISHQERKISDTLDGTGNDEEQISITNPFKYSKLSDTECGDSKSESQEEDDVVPPTEFDDSPEVTQINLNMPKPLPSTENKNSEKINSEPLQPLPLPIPKEQSSSPTPENSTTSQPPPQPTTSTIVPSAAAPPPPSQTTSSNTTTTTKRKAASNLPKPDPKRPALTGKIVRLKDGRTVLVRDGKIVGLIKKTKKAVPISGAPKQAARAPPITGTPQTNARPPAVPGQPTMPPPMQPSTDGGVPQQIPGGPHPPPIGGPPHPPPNYAPPRPSVSVSFPAGSFPMGNYYAPQYNRYNNSDFSNVQKEAMQSVQQQKSEPPKKYDLEEVQKALQSYMNSQTPGDAMARWKFPGFTGYQLRTEMIQSFPGIRVTDFEVKRWDEFALKYVKKTEMVGLNVRVKPEIPTELQKPMDVVVSYLKKSEPKKIEDRVFWNGIGLSVILGHVQKVCPEFRFQKWYKKWKKFISEIPECEFYQEGNHLWVRLHVKNRNEILQKETIRREIEKIKQVRYHEPYKQKLAIIEKFKKMKKKKESIALVDFDGKCPIEFPVKGPRCTHFQPFEITHYLKNNLFSKKKTSEHERWRCQVCGELAKKDDLLFDGYFEKVISNEKIKECKPDLIVIHEDGTVSFKHKNASEGEGEEEKENIITFDPITQAEHLEEIKRLEEERLARLQRHRLEEKRKIQIKITSEISNDKSDSSDILSEDEESKTEIRPNRSKPPPPPREKKRLADKASLNRKRPSAHDMYSPNVKRRRTMRRQKRQRARNDSVSEEDGRKISYTSSSSSRSEEDSSEHRRDRGKRRNYGADRRGKRAFTNRRSRRSYSSRSRSNSRGRNGRHRRRGRRGSQDSRSRSNNKEPAVSTSLLELYTVLVTKETKTKKGRLTEEESKQLEKLRDNCSVTPKQHLDVLAKLGLLPFKK